VWKSKGVEVDSSVYPVHALAWNIPNNMLQINRMFCEWGSYQKPSTMCKTLTWNKTAICVEFYKLFSNPCEDFGCDPVRTVEAVCDVIDARDKFQKTIEKLTMPELKETAKVRGVTFLASIRKPKLLSHLLENVCVTLSCPLNATVTT